MLWYVELLVKTHVALMRGFTHWKIKSSSQSIWISLQKRTWIGYVIHQNSNKTREISDIINPPPAGPRESIRKSFHVGRIIFNPSLLREGCQNNLVKSLVFCQTPNAVKSLGHQGWISQYLLRFDWARIHSIIIYRKGLDLTLPILPCLQGRISRHDICHNRCNRPLRKIFADCVNF